ncbi:DUF4149 domain-containing protein [Ramlibacter rhizophilus]|uniref:DUF4149 domain-containing protein n=1 Tax=Ramlibacter rhizophilus TaxID=1781167 RepID=A0A4Z0BQQ5_9BURK|nr:DUF4149 domain-containing protein [Ramlibacter rhizophilus]TFZ01627.1 DUF4149 domain-containing protein [Ramlibacter rhizophilus]
MAARERLALFTAALWWGSLSAVGFWVVPLLFAHLPSPALAGGTAARLFSAQTWVAVGCALVLLLATRDASASMARPLQGLVIAGLLLALLVEFGVAPRIVARENLRVWHSVGSAMYLLQWVCAGLALWRLAGAKE